MVSDIKYSFFFFSVLLLLLFVIEVLFRRDNARAAAYTAGRCPLKNNNNYP